MINKITFGQSAPFHTTQYTKLDGGSSRLYEVNRDRRVRDTVEISEDGQKIINLSRGLELANQLPHAGADREAFDEALVRAQEDIKRITTLFGGVLNLVTKVRPRFSEDRQGPTSEATPNPDIAEQLRKAFNQIRRISAEIGHNLQHRPSEF